MLHDIQNPSIDMFNSLIKNMKLANWKSLANPVHLQFIDKYSTLPEGTIAQITAQASAMDLLHLIAILLVLIHPKIDLLDIATVHIRFGIGPAHSEYATIKLQEILKPTSESNADQCP